MNSGKYKILFKTPIKLAHDASKEARQLFVANIVETAAIVLSDFRCIMEENPLTITFQELDYDILMASINFLEALSEKHKRKTLMLYKELCSTQDSVSRVLTLLLSCRKVSPPLQSGPRSACMCN